MYTELKVCYKVNNENSNAVIFVVTKDSILNKMCITHFLLACRLKEDGDGGKTEKAKLLDYRSKNTLITKVKMSGSFRLS